jgi:argininosuccinate synthase
MSRQKIVLAYSGGLDTSVLVRILGDDYGYDVIACHADVGEAKDKEYLSMRARKAGASLQSSTRRRSSRRTSASRRCKCAVSGRTAFRRSLRPLIARHLVAAA